MYLSEDYIAGVLQRLTLDGPQPWDDEAEPPPMAGVDRDRDAKRELIRRGLAEVTYDKLETIIRAKASKHEEKRDILPYEETPAVLAMRARRRAIGR